jgi:hypothetical protein
MRNLTLSYFTDPGHGWVSIKIEVLKNLGIADKVSNYSYTRGASAYLEEDSDLGLLYATCDALGIKIDLLPKHTNNRSPIRSYATYNAERVTC